MGLMLNDANGAKREMLRGRLDYSNVRKDAASQLVLSFRSKLGTSYWSLWTVVTRAMCAMMWKQRGKILMHFCICRARESGILSHSGHKDFWIQGHEQSTGRKKEKLQCSRERCSVPLYICKGKLIMQMTSIKVKTPIS